MANENVFIVLFILYFLTKTRVKINRDGAIPAGIEPGSAKATLMPVIEDWLTVGIRRVSLTVGSNAYRGIQIFEDCVTKK